MTDLHCHILPGIDDGAKDVDTSIALLRQEKAVGVKNVIFTPHFDCSKTTLSEFLKKRESSFEKLLESLPSDLGDLNFKLGAEVFFSPALRGVDLGKLCYTDTSYLLIELPFVQKPQFLRETLYDICCDGITPIIAHVERYEYMLSDLTQVYDLVEAGNLIQTNGATIADGDRLIRKMIDWDLIQLVASDAHSEHRRPVVFDLSYEKLIQNGNDVFDNYEIVASPHFPKKTIFGWK